MPEAATATKPATKKSKRKMSAAARKRIGGRSAEKLGRSSHQNTFRVANRSTLARRLESQQPFGRHRDNPRAKFAMSADGRIVRVRPTPVLLRQHYRKHRVPTITAFESDIVSISIAENTVTVFIDAGKIRHSCHTFLL
jgi:hypothetical protein